VVVLVLEEVGQAFLPAPAGVAEGAPVVVVAGLTAHVDHAVDARRTAQHLAAWIAQLAAVEPRVFVGVEEPVRARVADAIEVADRDVDPVIVVLAAGFDEQHALAWVSTQAVGQKTAGGAGTADDVVV